MQWLPTLSQSCLWTTFIHTLGFGGIYVVTISMEMILISAFAFQSFMIMLAQHRCLAFSSDSYLIQFNFPSAFLTTFSFNILQPNPISLNFLTSYHFQVVVLESILCVNCYRLKRALLYNLFKKILQSNLSLSL